MSTLIATTRTAEQDATLVVPVTASDAAWLSVGEALVQMRAEQVEATYADAATADQRDAAGFAARGLELAIETWNDVTASFRGTGHVWTEFTRLLGIDLADNGLIAPVRTGLALARDRAAAIRAEYVAVYGG